MNKNSFHYIRARFLLWNLVFSFLLMSCAENKKESSKMMILWKNEKAVAIIIPLSLMPNDNRTSIFNKLSVRLMNNSTPVLHDEFEFTDQTIVFKPQIPFTHGLKYKVYFSDKIIGHFEIPPVNTNNLTEIVSVYPTTDTLPENALKLYVVFSKPMQEGSALNNISLIKNDKDTLSSVFLDLNQELWNKERTILTLWFDPGRIKRDLQPNKNLGSPLQQNNNYKLIIDKNWKDERGLALRSNYIKEFSVGKRDNSSPDPDSWNINQPKASTKEALMIYLHESLDYLLLKNAFNVTDDKGNTINGSFEPSSKETILIFTPSQTWKPGEFNIKIEARLEDIAGNNLNRLFDNDLTQSNKNEQQTMFIKKFRVN